MSIAFVHFGVILPLQILSAAALSVCSGLVSNYRVITAITAVITVILRFGLGKPILAVIAVRAVTCHVNGNYRDRVTDDAFVSRRKLALTRLLPQLPLSR